MTGNYVRPLVALAAAMLVSVAPGVAAPAYENASVKIDTRGIDLASASGRQTLDRRLETAITAICGEPVFGTREESDELRACRNETRTAVAPQVQRLLASATTDRQR